MTYPINDNQFEESAIKSVSKEENGWSIKRDDGWSFYVPADSPVEPKEGMIARFYGKGIGYSVRGLYLDGKKCFYRTEAEQKENEEISTYGADAADWLRKWDEEGHVWTIEMGGLGPGYEQCIHIACAEILRHMLESKYDASAWDSDEARRRDIKNIEEAGMNNRIIDKLGLSGAQWGAALSLACFIYRDGPRKLMTDEKYKDRKIQVNRVFPNPYKEGEPA